MLKNYWYAACVSSELQVGQVLGRLICGQPVALYRTASGAAAAVHNICPHRQAPLSMGAVVGEGLQCRYHGMEFNASGRCVHIPSQDVIPPKAHIRAYAALERYGFLWLWMGAVELAKPELIPQFSWREESGWNSDLVQYFHVKAPAQMMSDNLLDLSHVAFLHASSIGFDPKRLENDPLQVQIGERTVTTSRTFKNTLQAPAHKAWRELAEPIDRVQQAQWSAPSVVSVLVRNENGVEQVDLRADHLITPETDSSHHYFVALSRNFRVQDPGFTQALDRDTRRVHLEDVEIAEAQQEIRRWNGGAVDMALQADKAVNASHRILKRLREEESQDAAA